jgi:hypothetical protein
MYEVFAGSLPFQGESFMGILTQHITTEPEPVAQRAAKAHRPLPPGLAEIITRCMQKNPAQRYSSMDELVGALVQVYRAVAGAGMSTYMEAFPVSARLAAPTPPPLTGGVMAQPTAATVAHSGGYAQPGHATPGYGAGHVAPGHATPGYGAPPQTGPSVAASASGLHDPSASLSVPKKSKTGLVIAIVAVVVVVGAIAAIVVLGAKKKQQQAGDGSGSQIAALGSDGSSANAGGSGSEQPDHPGSNGSAGSGDPTNGSGGSGGSGDPWNGSGDPTHGSAQPPIDAGVATAPVDAAVAAVEQLEVKLVGKNVIAFEVYEAGKKLFDGPDDLMITPGTPRTVVIKARGFKDKKIVVDGKKKRLELRLDRIPGERPDPPPTMNCSAKIIDPTSKACVEQYCAKHPDEVKCTL